MAKSKKDQRIEDERNRLMTIFSEIDKNKFDFVSVAVRRLAFITVEMEDLEKKLSRVGWTEDYQNGANQSGIKKSANAEVYISLQKNMTTIISQLVDLVPVAKRMSRLDELRKA